MRSLEEKRHLTSTTSRPSSFCFVWYNYISSTWLLSFRPEWRCIQNLIHQLILLSLWCLTPRSCPEKVWIEDEETRTCPTRSWKASSTPILVLAEHSMKRVFIRLAKAWPSSVETCRENSCGPCERQFLSLRYERVWSIRNEWRSL